MLVEAQNPLIICDRVARTTVGMANLVDLAETLQCGVIDNAGRMNFPSRHPLNQSFRRGLISQADVILAIEMNDLWGTVTAFSDRIVRRSRPITKPGAKIITLGVRDLYLKSNYQDFGRWQDVDLDIAGDGEASLPALTEAVRRLIDEGRKAAYAARGKKLAAAHLAMVEQSKTDATIGWDSSPITTARMCAEVYAQIKDEDWSVVGTAIRLTWPHRLWCGSKPPKSPMTHASTVRSHSRVRAMSACAPTADVSLQRGRCRNGLLSTFCIAEKTESFLPITDASRTNKCPALTSG